MGLHAVVADDDQTAIDSQVGTVPSSGADAADSGGVVQLGAYRLMQRLGQGGAGTVYRAELTEDRAFARTGAEVAVKVLRPDLQMLPGAFQRFLREAQLGEALAHDAVVHTYEADFSMLDGQPRHFLVMEYVQGHTLRELLEDTGAMPEALVRHLGAQVGNALAAVHKSGAVHRDVKPGNILITPDHRVKLMDLGLVHVIDDDQQLTRTEQFLGTLAYAAPEQFETPGDVGPAADLYSLGLTLFEAAAGRRAFRSREFAALMRDHLETVPPRLRTLRAELSPFVDELVARLLDKDPAARFAGAAALAGVLEEGEASEWWSRQQATRAIPAPDLAVRLPVAREAPLVARDRELGELQANFAEARSGHGRVVLIEGEAGVGKTRLLAEFLDAVGADGRAGAQVLYGAYPPGDSAGAYTAFVDAVRALLPGGDVAAELTTSYGFTTGLGRSLASLLSGPGPQAPPSREAIHAGFCQLARSLSRRTPVVWVIDDLHQASAEGAQLLLSLARIAHELRILIVVGSRPGLSSEALAHLQRQPATRRLSLERLSARAVVQLLAELFRSDKLAERLGGKVALKSDGNPFFVLEMIRELRERGALTRTSDGSYEAVSDITEVGVPSSVRDLILARLDDLSDDERRLLDLGAVIGNPFDPDLVARVCEVRRLKVLESLAAVERRTGVLRAAGAGFAFDYPQLRDVILNAVPPPLRTEYHGLVAEAYEERLGTRQRGAGVAGLAPGCNQESRALSNDDAVFLASHYLRGNRPELGLPLVAQALEYLAVGYRHEALIELADLALTAATATADEALACDVCLAQAESLEFLGHVDEQRRVLTRARKAAENANDGRRLSRVQRQLGWLHYSLGQLDDAERELLTAVREARSRSDLPAEAHALNKLALVLHDRGSSDEARAQLEQSLELSRRGVTRVAEMNAESNLGIVLLDQGRYEQARARFSRQLELALALDDRKVASRAAGNLGLAHLYLGDYDQAGQHYETQIELCRDIGYRTGEAIATGNLGGLAYDQGQLGRARELFERYIHLTREVGNRLGETIGVLNHGTVRFDEGDLDGARDELERALDSSRQVDARRVEADALHTLGELARTRGDGRQARLRHEQALKLRRSLGGRGPIAASELALGRLALDTGDDVRAREHFRRAAEVVTRYQELDPGPLPAAYLALLDRPQTIAVEVPRASPAPIRAEAYAVLYRAGAGDRHRLEAETLLARMSAHLDGRQLERFRLNHPVARLLGGGRDNPVPPARGVPSEACRVIPFR